MREWIPALLKDCQEMLLSNTLISSCIYMCHSFVPSILVIVWICTVLDNASVNIVPNTLLYIALAFFQEPFCIFHAEIKLFRY